MINYELIIVKRTGNISGQNLHVEFWGNYFFSTYTKKDSLWSILLIQWGGKKEKYEGYFGSNASCVTLLAYYIRNERRWIKPSHQYSVTVVAM